MALHFSPNWTSALRYHHLPDPAERRINPQGVIDGALVRLGTRGLATLCSTPTLCGRSSCRESTTTLWNVGMFLCQRGRRSSRLLGTRQGNLTGEQLGGDELRLPLDLRWYLGQR